MIRRLVLSYVTVAVLVLLCLEIPLGYLYGRIERERVEGQPDGEHPGAAARSTAIGREIASNRPGLPQASAYR